MKKLFFIASILFSTVGFSQTIKQKQVDGLGDSLATRAYNISTTPLALTDAATVTWNYATSPVAKVTLGGNRTLSVSNVPDGQVGVLRIKQDATGSRTLTLPGVSNFALSTAANAENVLQFINYGGTLYWTADVWDAGSINTGNFSQSRTIGLVDSLNTRIIGVYRKPGTDSVFKVNYDNSLTFQYIDSVGGGGGGGTAAGSTGNVQINSSGSFAGSNNLHFASNTLSISDDGTIGSTYRLFVKNNAGGSVAQFKPYAASFGSPGFDMPDALWGHEVIITPYSGGVAFGAYSASDVYLVTSHAAIASWNNANGLYSVNANGGSGNKLLYTDNLGTYKTSAIDPALIDTSLYLATKHDLVGLGGGGTTTNALSIAAELHSGGATSFNGSAAISLAIQAGSVTNSMLAGSIALSKLSITGTPDGTKYLRDDGSWQTISSGGMANPMTTANDIIIGGASGTPTRLAVGGEGTALTVSGGNVTWASGTPWNGGYASSASGDLGGSTFTNTNTTLQVHTGGAGTTTLPLVSGGYTKVLHFVNQGTGNLTISRQGTDQIFYHGANATSFILAPGGSAVVGLLNSKWVVWFDGYNPTGSAATLTTPRTIWGQSFDGSANVTGDITLGAANITLTGSIGATGARATKVWTTDAEFTNMPTIGGTSLSSTTSTLTNKTIASATNNVEGTLVNVRFLTSGTTYTPTSGTTKALIVMIGAGGGGGGVTGAASSVGAAGGGGAGGYCVKFITGVTGTYTYAIGTAGTAGANTGANGGNGGNTTFANGATTYTAFGGSGGVGQTTGTAAAFVLGGAGAVVSTNGDINAGGSPGLMAYRVSGTLGYSGTGGDTEYGGAGIGLTSAAAGSAATGYGAGGGGALSTANTARAGGAGAPGLIIIYEYK